MPLSEALIKTTLSVFLYKERLNYLTDATVTSVLFQNSVRSHSTHNGKITVSVSGRQGALPLIGLVFFFINSSSSSYNFPHCYSCAVQRRSHNVAVFQQHPPPSDPFSCVTAPEKVLTMSCQHQTGPRHNLHPLFCRLAVERRWQPPRLQRRASGGARSTFGMCEWRLSRP